MIQECIPGLAILIIPDVTDVTDAHWGRAAPFRSFQECILSFAILIIPLPLSAQIVSAVMASRNDLDAHHGRLRRCRWWIGMKRRMERVWSREGYLGGGRWRP